MDAGQARLTRSFRWLDRASSPLALRTPCEGPGLIDEKEDWSSDRFPPRRDSYDAVTLPQPTHPWAHHGAHHEARLLTLLSLVSLACGPGGAGTTASADTEPGTGSTTDDTDGSGPTSSEGSADGATATDGATSTDGTTATDGNTSTEGATDSGDDCEPAVDDCPNGMARGCPMDLVGTNLVSERVLGLTCAPGCPGPTTSLELYDSATAQRTTLAETEPEIVPAALAVAPDGSVVVGGWYDPLQWEPPSAATLHRYSPEGALLWTAEFEDASFESLVVRGDEILGIAGEDVVAYALADGSPTWTVPTGLRPSDLATASDGTLYVYAWDGVASFEGRHVLAFDSDHALLWDVLDASVPDQERRLEELIVDEAGGLILAAQVTVVPLVDDVIELRKLDVTGSEVWSVLVDAGTVPNDDNDDRLFDAVALAGGGVIAVGRGANPEGSQPLAVAFDADGNELWSDAGELGPSARFEHAVRVGDEALAMGCGNGEWFVAYPP